MRATDTTNFETLKDRWGKAVNCENLRVAWCKRCLDFPVRMNDTGVFLCRTRRFEELF